MEHQAWMVKNLRGKKLGSIRKLIIDSTARQIAYADLAVGDGPRIVRIPWGLFQVNAHGILLVATQEELAEVLPPDSSAPTHGAVTLEVETIPSERTHRKRQPEKRTDLRLRADCLSVAGHDP